MSPLSQTRQLMPLLEAIRNHLGAAGSRYVCDPNTPKASIYNAIRRALNDAREEWS